MKKILFIFSFSLLVLLSKGQSYQNYQWQGFEPGIFCSDTMSLECDVEHFAVDTGRNTLWIIGDFNGADTTHSPGIVGYKNNEFVKFPGITDSVQNGNDYLIYNGNMVTCDQYGVYIIRMDSLIVTQIGTFPTSLNWGGTHLVEYNGDLYVGGQFTAIKGPTGGWVTSWSIARWDGTQWNPLGSGLVGSPWVNDLMVFQNKLIVGGTFDIAGGIDAWNIAAWDGANWSNLWTGNGGYGTNKDNGNHQGAYVRDLELFQNNLYIIGDIDSVCGIPAHIAYWNGTNWTGTSYPLHAKLFKSFLNHLIVFTNENALQIDWWENNQMIPVDSMFDQVYIGAMETFNDTFFLSGGFLSSGSTPLFRLARLVYDSTNVGVKQLIMDNEQLIIYPNPDDEKLFISNKKNSSEASVKVFNYTGQLVYEKTNFKDEAIDTKQLSNGIYLLRYSTDNYFSSVKFVVQH